MTSTNTDILGERTALERMIYDLTCQIDSRLDEGGQRLDGLGEIGLTIEGAQERVRYLENILVKYKLLEKAAEQYKNPKKLDPETAWRFISSAKMIRYVREMLQNIRDVTPHESALLKAAMLILDSAIEELERNDL